MRQPYQTTGKREKILRFIRAYVQAHGYPPSIIEIGEAVGISSTSHVSYYLRQLQAMGKIEVAPRRARAIRITGEA
jgi:repressor LexA